MGRSFWAKGPELNPRKEQAMMSKKVLCRERLRRVPEHFSWVDHRLVRDEYIRR